MAAITTQPPVFVLTLEAVRWGIDTLKKQKIHPFFLAYIHLRKRAVELGMDSDISADWEELAQYLPVKGGPPSKPYYRPFWHGKSTEPGRYWLNPNLAGSYAPSSLRDVPYKVIDTSGSHFSLKPDHAGLAREHLLFDEPVSCFALAAFFFRDFGISTPSAVVPAVSDLLAVFRNDFNFLPQDPHFDVLFSLEQPTDVQLWFEPLDADTVGVE